MSRKHVVEFLDEAAFQPVERLPDPHYDIAWGLLDHLREHPRFGKPLENNAATGDLSDARSMYVIDLEEREVGWPPPYRSSTGCCPRNAMSNGCRWSGPASATISRSTARRPGGSVVRDGLGGVPYPFPSPHPAAPSIASTRAGMHRRSASSGWAWASVASSGRRNARPPSSIGPSAAASTVLAMATISRNGACSEPEDHAEPLPDGIALAEEIVPLDDDERVCRSRRRVSSSGTHRRDDRRPPP